jgi:DUF1365 family protein
VTPLVLALIASVKRKNSRNNAAPLRHSALCVGRVWHTRLQPKRHAFTYPIFMFALDLEEVEAFQQLLRPLSPWIVQFRKFDHLKNGEGLRKDSPSKQCLADCLLHFVTEKTKNKFTPSLQTHRIMLLTHLCYYGYNFNPVSFYYIIDKNSNKIEAMVGEVSNTPWTEMYCYVLHPDSVDRVQFKEKVGNDFQQKLDYSFPKEFHVSPFMEMGYWYDWSFAGVPENDSYERKGDSIIVVNTLRKRSNNETHFTAKLIMDPKPITPVAVAWQMIRMPVFCMIIQIWIHYQAALLFIKGIVYIPHPQGSETAASRAIASIMVPFFAIRDYINPKSKIA